MWAWLRPRWETLWPVAVADAPPGPWCKAAAVQRAAQHAHADILVVADADVWCDTVDQAVAAVEGGAPWAIPHDRVHRLTAQATTNVVNGQPFDVQPLDQRPYRGHAGGGIVVLPADTLAQVPLDPRFVGWGQEDDSWAAALTTVAGRPWRGHSPLWHLWHPPAERINRRVGSRDGERLWGRYLRATKNPQRMHQLLEEARHAHAAA